ncbi:MAG: hypothetical protein KME23_12315 [Goleter apudmare HA4340-LM2]|jgi:HSP20 family protein|nr:hypothetical protein [Goleter apudmare HA4340-LM2]
MTLVRWNPWREIDTIQRQMNNFFEESKVERGLIRVPAAELQETEDALRGCFKSPLVGSKMFQIPLNTP